MPRLRCLLLPLLLASIAPALLAQSEAFGQRERTTGVGMLTGIFYDLKQTQQRKPIPNKPSYLDRVSEFVLSGLDEAEANRYFRAPLPLYTTRIMIPNMSADRAPQAFGVADSVSPRRWVIHYKAQVSPGFDGPFRFLGSSDDIMVVLVNQRVVLVGNHPGNKFPESFPWLRPPQDSQPANGINRVTTFGEWLVARRGEIIDLDILVGENPGGEFNAQLLWQRRDIVYPIRGDRPVYPVFEISPPGEGPAPDWTGIE